MKRISEFLFGRVLKFQDEKIGELKTKVRSYNPSVNYTWIGEYKLSGQEMPTVFILEGNSVGPYKTHLKSVYRIVDTIDEISNQIDQELKGRLNIKQRFKLDWKSEFYLAAITPYNPNLKGLGDQFEINFEPIKTDDLDYIGLIWENDRLTEIEVN